MIRIKLKLTNIIFAKSWGIMLSIWY